MTKKYVIMCVWSLSAILNIQAQRIVFEKDVVDAGATMWKRPVTAVFKFSNKGRNPLRVTDVDAGCGCLKTEWPKKALSRGENGEIRITYDAMQLGHFDRYIDVYTNANSQPARIRMQALVDTVERRDLTKLFPYSIDNILLNTNNIEFTDVHAGDSSTVQIEILNNGTDVYTPSLMHLPAYITASYKPEMLARGKSGVIELTLHSDKLPDLGLNQTSIYLARYSGDKVGTNNEITVSAVLLPDLKYAEGFAKKPILNISTTELNLGKLGRKTKISGTVKLSNTGTGVLKMNKIQAFNQAITIALKKTELQPGETVKMKVTVDSRFLGMSKAEPRVLIITNDTQRAKEVVNVKFEK